MKTKSLSWPHHEIQRSYFQFLFIKWCATGNFEAQSKRNCKEILIRLTRPWSFLRFKTRLRGCERPAVIRQMGRWGKRRLRRETAFPSLPCALFSPTSFFDDILKQKRDEDRGRIRERNPSLKEEGGRTLLPHGQTKV